jgi:glycosyltransferase involved in cell wall biosynthesis
MILFEFPVLVYGKLAAMSHVEFSLVVPLYQSEACLPDLMKALPGMASKLPGPMEVIFVVDGSPDNCFAILSESLEDWELPSQLVVHSRNFGAFAAARTGMQHARGRYSAIMAADMQEPPELIQEMFEELHQGDVDVVVAVRRSRKDPSLGRWFSQIFWAFYRRFVIPEMPEGGVGTIACNAVFREQILKLVETQTSLIGLIFWLGFRRKEVHYDRVMRAHGKSGWSLGKKINYLLDSVFSFSDLPIRLFLYIGMIGLIFSVLLGGSIFVSRFLGLIADVPGYMTTMVTILFFGCINIIGLGIIGAYVWRAFGNTQQRPLAVVMQRKEFFDK